MKEKNKKKLILFALAVLIPIIGLIGVIVYLKLFNRTSSK